MDCDSSSSQCSCYWRLHHYDIIPQKLEKLTEFCSPWQQRGWYGTQTWWDGTGTVPEWIGDERGVGQPGVVWNVHLSDWTQLWSGGQQGSQTHQPPCHSGLEWRLIEGVAGSECWVLFSPHNMFTLATHTSHTHWLRILGNLAGTFVNLRFHSIHQFLSLFHVSHFDLGLCCHGNSLSEHKQTTHPSFHPHPVPLSPPHTLTLPPSFHPSTLTPVPLSPLHTPTFPLFPSSHPHPVPPLPLTSTCCPPHTFAPSHCPSHCPPLSPSHSHNVPLPPDVQESSRSFLQTILQQ